MTILSPTEKGVQGAQLSSLTDSTDCASRYFLDGDRTDGEDSGNSLDCSWIELSFGKLIVEEMGDMQREPIGYFGMEAARLASLGAKIQPPET